MVKRIVDKFEFNSLKPSDTYICQYIKTIISPVNGLPPGQRQAIIWTNGGIFSIKLQWNFERHPYIIIQEMHLEMYSVKWWQFLSRFQCFNMRFDGCPILRYFYYS